jgi:hypothetical protein
MSSTLIVLFGIGLNAIGTFAYLIDTFKGRVKPNKITYVMWSLAPIIAFLAQIDQGVGIQSLMTLSIGIFPLSILLASFFNKHAYWKVNTFDLFCGALSLGGLILWQITKVGNIAIAFSILADFLALLPTLIKSYKYPETELAWPWTLASLSGLLTLLTITQWDFSTYSFPLYYFVSMATLFVTIEIRSRITNKPQQLNVA